VSDQTRTAEKFALPVGAASAAGISNARDFTNQPSSSAAIPNQELATAEHAEIAEKIRLATDQIQMHTGEIKIAALLSLSAFIRVYLWLNSSPRSRGLSL
jgi:hypothetical protein